MIPPRQAWHRLTRMQQMVAQQPALARAVSYMTLYDQLDLTLELLHMGGGTYLDEDPIEPWPSNSSAFEHSSPAMARRYTDSAAKRQGARLIPRYSPV